MATQIIDENCDPNNPKKIVFDDVLAATRRIVGSVVRTPCRKSHMSESLGMDLYYKLEIAQYTGSFKERGACNAIMCLPEEKKRYGVISATTGNHGGAMTYQAGLLGVPCIIVIPTTTSIFKTNKITSLGTSKVIPHGANIIESMYYAMDLTKEKKMTYINGFDHPDIVAGAGSCGIEILEQVPDVDAILIPVGGGGFVCGVAIAVKHLKPDTEIYGIGTDKCYSMAEAFKKNERVYIDIECSIADSLGVNRVGVNTFYNLKGIMDKMVIVKEEWITKAITIIGEEERLYVEGAAATGVASIMAGLLPNLKGKKVVCILSGGNMDPTMHARAIERGLSIEGRLVKFKVKIQDKPGSLAEFTSQLNSIGVSMHDIVPERVWTKDDPCKVLLKVVAETRGREHSKELYGLIKKLYKEFYFNTMPEKGDKGGSRPRGPCLAPNPCCMHR